MKKKNKIWIPPLTVMVVFLMFTNSCKKDKVDNNNNSNTVKDIDGNVYHTVTIGTQVWMVENLKTTIYNDGTAIPKVTDNAAWAALATPAMCTYNNTTNNDTINTYGRLYNWYAVNTGKLCPIGWHVPSVFEWTILTNFLGGESVAGGKLKEIGTKHWASPNTSADNTTGFTAIPGGARENGTAGNIGNYGNWWSSPEFSSAIGWSMGLLYNASSAYSYNSAKTYGFSVRCLRD